MPELGADEAVTLTVTTTNGQEFRTEVSGETYKKVCADLQAFGSSHFHCRGADREGFPFLVTLGPTTLAVIGQRPHRFVQGGPPISLEVTVQNFLGGQVSLMLTREEFDELRKHHAGICNDAHRFGIDAEGLPYAILVNGETFSVRAKNIWDGRRVQEL